MIMEKLKMSIKNDYIFYQIVKWFPDKEFTSPAFECID